MTQAQHTPGPWWVSKTFPARVAGKREGHTFVSDCLGGESEDDAETLANATLIAAAPELLDQLKKLRRAYVSLLESGRDRIINLGGTCDPVDVMEANDPNLRDVAQIISKATGSAA